MPGTAFFAGQARVSRGMTMSFQAAFRQNGSAVVLGRIAGIDGSGAATTRSGEGNWYQRADISGITYAIFDLSGADRSTPIVGPTALTIADVVLDVPVTSTAVWTQDAIGYNFRHDLPADSFPVGNHKYTVQYKVTLTGGAVFIGEFSGVAEPTLGD